MTAKQQLRMLKRLEADALKRFDRAIISSGVDSSHYRTILNRGNQYCKAYSALDGFVKTLESVGITI